MKTQIIKSVVICLGFLIPSLTWAYDFEGYVEVGEGSELFVKYDKAEPGKQTLVFVNGLVYSIERWEPVTSQLAEQGFGVLHFDFEGQDRSYVHAMDKYNGEPPFMKKGISLEGMSEQLDSLVTHFGIENFALVGLSYGSALATEYAQRFPDKINHIVYISPLVLPLDYYEPQGYMFRTWLASLEWWGPVGTFWANYYYDLVYGWYFGMKSGSSGVDYGQWTDKYHRAVFHQIKAIKDFNLKEVPLDEVLTDGKVHMLTASNEDSRYLEDQNGMWNIWSEEIKGGLVNVQEGYHALPDTNPSEMIKILIQIASDDDAFSAGQSYVGSMRDGELVLEPSEL
ncbi:MAG: alpha/beta hydrolase [Bdellovibrionales bacterium]|nr:alpha/beta hydrolase [Bdellovibrionales bacterium]